MKRCNSLLLLIVFFGSWVEVLAMDRERIYVPVSSTPISTTFSRCDVEPIAQWASLFCWAASMQMITKYHGLEKTQCQLRAELERLDGREVPPSFIENCLSLSCSSTTFESFSLTGSGSWNDAISDPYELKTLFTRVHFNSTVAENRLRWSTVKAQIDSCHPFISVICEGCEDDMGNEHAVVATGYWESGTNLLIVNDPWGVNRCEYASYYLNYPATVTGNMNPIIEAPLITMQSFVRSIEPSSKRNRLTCQPTRKSTKTIPVPRPADIRHSTRSTSKSEMKSKKPHFYVRVYYLSPKLLRNRPIPITLDSVKTKHKVFDMICTAQSRYLIYTLQPNRTNKWQPIRIAYSDYPKSLTCVLNGSQNQILLTYRNDVAGAIPYECVKIPALFQRYYRFYKQGNPYLVPAIAYQLPRKNQLMPEILLPNTAYPEQEVLTKIHDALN